MKLLEENVGENLHEVRLGKIYTCHQKDSLQKTKTNKLDFIKSKTKLKSI